MSDFNAVHVIAWRASSFCSGPCLALPLMFKIILHGYAMQLRNLPMIRSFGIKMRYIIQNTRC